MEPLYWQHLDELVYRCKLVIDRPHGTPHPRYPDFIYPFDYGYLEGTRAMDQGGIDVWVGSLPERHVCGIVATLDLSKQDAEIKILLGCTRGDADIILATHNSGAQSAILIWRAAA